MIEIPTDNMEKRALYRLLTSAVVPRPIALITTESEGIVNAAPFSFFNVVTSKPARLSVAIGRRNKVLKDTARNIFDRKRFMVNVVTADMLEDMNKTSKDCPPDESEIPMTAFTIEKDKNDVPMILQSPIRLSCSLDTYFEFEDTTLFIGKVETMYIDDKIYKDNAIDVKALNPIGRLSGTMYGLLGQYISLERPR